MKKIFAAVLLLCIFCAPLRLFAENQTIDELFEWEKSQASHSEKLFDKEFLSLAASSPSDWYAFAAAVTGLEDGSKYLSALKSAVEKLDITTETATSCQRIAITVLALGGDPTDFGKDANGNPIDLIAQGVYNRKNLGAQGINGYIWGLITLDAKPFPVPQEAEYSRDAIIEKIISSQLSDGGFSLDGKTSETDLTAMALTALSPYREKFAESIDRALAYLSSVQENDGGFGSCESTAQVIVALCSLGKDPNDFVKNGNGALSALMKYKNTDGGFFHSSEALKSNSLAGSQALCALIAYERLCSKQDALYNLQNHKPPVKSYNLTPIVVFTSIGIAGGVVIVVLLHKRRKK